MIPHIKHAFVSELDASLKEAALQGEFAPRILLHQLKLLGFDPCLFYDAAPNPVSGDYQIILSAVEGNVPQTNLLGARVDYKDTAIGSNHGSRDPTVQQANDETQPRGSTELARKLGTFSLNRVHTPLYYHDQLIGAFTCGWNGDVDILSDDHLAALKTIASLVSKYWAIAIDIIAANLVDTIQGSFPRRESDDEVDSLLEDVVRLSRVAVSGRAAAIFEYNCYSGLLHKRFEDILTDPSEPSISEVYPAGKFVTGRAWLSTDERHIVDFDAYQKHFEREVDQNSLVFHSRVLGGVHTLLYSSLKTTNGKYLIRIINREDQRALPFCSSHRIVLEKITTALSPLLEESFTNAKLTGLQEVARTAISNITDPEKTIFLTTRELRHEGVEDVLVVAYRDGHDHLSHLLTGDRRLRDALPTRVRWKEEPFLVNAFALKAIRVLDLANFSGPKGENSLATQLKAREYRFVVVVPFVSPALKGFMLVPCPPNTQGTLAGIRARLPTAHKESLNAYASLIGSCLATEDSHLTAENAKRLIAQIGHEVQGPVARLGQRSIERIGDLMELIDEMRASGASEKLDTRMRTLEEAHEELASRMQQISTVMDVAMDMAQEAEGVLQVHFSEFDLFHLLQEATREVEATTDLIDAYDRPQTYRFELNDACRRFPRLVGDRDLLLKVFTNVLKNAVKYSLPPGRNQPTVIEVFGLPQTGWNIVQVRNWGVRVPPELGDKIFNPFVRGDLKDRLKARRGMGLGLYIARRFASAHQGDVSLAASESTFDDPARREIEGWRTTFEIRLPTNLRPGTYDYEGT